MFSKSWIIIILLFSLSFVSGCTNHQPKYDVGDIITNTDGGPCYGLYIEGHDTGVESYIFKNVTQCDTANNSRWKYVGGAQTNPYYQIDFNPQIKKIDHIELDTTIPGPVTTWK